MAIELLWLQCSDHHHHWDLLLLTAYSQGLDHQHAMVAWCKTRLQQLWLMASVGLADCVLLCCAALADKAKLFPYCAGKIDASVCQVKYFTIPLTEAQAMLAMRRGLAYTPTEADIRSYPGKCRSNMLVNPDRPDDPHRCALNEGLNLQPVPLIPVSEFKNVNSVLQASYAVFEQLRTLLVVGQKLQYMQLQQLGEHQRAAADKHSSSSAAVHRGQSLDAAAVYGPIVRSKQAFQVQ